VVSDEMAESDPNYWQLGTSGYRLLALFESDERFAVLDQIDVASGTRKVIEARVGDVIDKYHVAAVSDRAMSVVNPSGDKIELVLFDQSQNQSKSED
jgi:hypothetical protein